LNSNIWLILTMKLRLLCVGKTNFNFLNEGENEYTNRLIHYCNLSRIDIPELKNAKSLSVPEIKNKEGQLILAKVQATDLLILLDENGKMYTSNEFATFFEKKMIQGKTSIVFVIGGAFGFSKEVYDRANESISLSKMTFSHQLIRIIFLEQLYRSFTILKGEKYHHN
jgi:23S rRNA (pseudouridine1915-N3)-methyltransferase